MNWPAHPDYKESGVARLRSVPAHWSVSRLSRHFTINGGQVDPRTDPFAAMPLIAPNHVESGTGKLLFVESAVEQGADSGKYLVNAGQIIYSKIRPSLAKAVIAPVDCLCSADMYGLSPDPRKPDPQFALYLLLSDPFTRHVVDSSMRVAMPKVNHESLGAAPVWYPPLGDQRSIVAFLDQETAKIDALIGKQNQLVATLREDRTATITHAVTKGLDPDAEPRDSGGASTAEVPADWSVAALKRVSLVQDCKHMTADFVDDGYPLASIREVQSRYVMLDAARRTTRDFLRALCEGGRSPSPGDLIFSRNATVGEVALVPDEAPEFAMGQDVCLLRPVGKDLDSVFLWYALRSHYIRAQLEVAMIGSTFKRINVEEVRTLEVVLPPLSVQQSIVANLDGITGRYDVLIAKSTEVIGALREYRAALITAAVTGKIDVREVLA